MVDCQFWQVFRASFGARPVSSWEAEVTSLHRDIPPPPSASCWFEGRVMIRLPIRATRSTNSVHKFARSSVRCYTLRTTESEMVVVVVIIGFLYELLNSFLYEPPLPSLTDIHESWSIDFAVAIAPLVMSLLHSFAGNWSTIYCQFWSERSTMKCQKLNIINSALSSYTMFTDIRSADNRNLRLSVIP